MGVKTNHNRTHQQPCHSNSTCKRVTPSNINQSHNIWAIYEKHEALVLILPYYNTMTNDSNTQTKIYFTPIYAKWENLGKMGKHHTIHQNNITFKWSSRITPYMHIRLLPLIHSPFQYKVQSIFSHITL